MVHVEYRKRKTLKEINEEIESARRTMFFVRALISIFIALVIAFAFQVELDTEGTRNFTYGVFASLCVISALYHVVRCTMYPEPIDFKLHIIPAIRRAWNCAIGREEKRLSAEKKWFLKNEDK